MAFMRLYGMQGDPGPRPAPRRKSAAAGPRAKAARKRVVRGQRAARGGQGAPKGPGKKKAGGFKLPGGFLPHGKTSGQIFDAASRLIGGAGGFEKALAGKMGKEGKQRRTKNPANVRALRRSLSRVEAFGKLVKRVNRMLPRAHQFQAHPVMKHKRRSKRA